MRIDRFSLSTGIRQPVAAILACLVLLSGCSSVPDALNPVEWYSSVSDLVSGSDSKNEDAAKTDAPPKPAPGADKPYPNLSTVPERSAGPTPEERDALAKGLVADREAARYSDEVIRRSGAESAGAAPREAKTEAKKAAEMAPAAPAAPASVGTPRRVSPATSDSAASTAMKPPEMPSPPQRPSVAAKTGGTLPPLPSAAPPRSTLEPALPPPAVAPASGRANELPPQFGPPPADIAVLENGVPASQAPLAAAPPPPQFAARADDGADSRFEPFGGTMATGLPIGTVRFAIGSATVGSRGRQLLRRIARIAREQQGNLVVVGHSSSRTRQMSEVRHEMVNFSLSLDRARSVARTLISMGVPAERIELSAESDREPIDDEDMPLNEARNRRAEIFFRSN